MAQQRHSRNVHKKKVLSVKKTGDYKLVDRVTYICAIIEPLLSVPQAYAIWSQRNATGVSITSFTGYWLFSFIWLWYGIEHKDNIIIMYEIMYIILGAVVIVGAVLFGGHW